MVVSVVVTNEEVSVVMVVVKVVVVVVLVLVLVEAQIDDNKSLCEQYKFKM